MHVRTTTRRQGGKTYRYVQLVESYRRENGMPAHRVIGNLGDLPERTVENLKLALRAARAGKAVVVADTASLSEQMQVHVNLRYLDLAVMLELWRAWRFDELLRKLLPGAETAAPAVDVVCALVLQRCVAPGSKLYAQRWLPTTALPELLGLRADRFNNTRLHRVLDQLCTAVPTLQDRLPNLYARAGVETTAFFIDVTDTYFEGRGCQLAQRHRTKEGRRNKWSIGLVLLANERGYPLRWQVIPSKTSDHIAMHGVIREVRGLPWVGEQPLVCDRAMGKQSSLWDLLESGLHFLTAVPVTCIESHTTAVPYRAFSELEIKGTDSSYQQDVALAAQTARDLGWEEVKEHLFVRDLGLSDFDPVTDDRNRSRSGKPVAQKRPLGNSVGAQILRARQLRALLDQGEYKSQTELAKAKGVSRQRVSQLFKLLRIAPEIQEQILAAPAELHLSESRLRPLLKEEDPETQRRMFRDILSSSSASVDSTNKNSPTAVRSAGEAAQLRLVAYFNPQMFVDQLRRARQHLAELENFLNEINQDLSTASRGRKEEATRRKIARRLEKYGYSDAFEISLVPISVTTKTGARIDSFRCKLELKPEQWERRQRYNGFVLLVGHPDLPHPARKLAHLYHAKDAIEKDFQTIKSVVKLRPIYHHTDPKVQAHVALCMLALLLIRNLKHRLQQANMSLSSEACMELLSTCHLNRLQNQSDGHAFYSVTRATIAQKEILEALGFSYLLDDSSVAGALKPGFVST